MSLMKTCSKCKQAKPVEEFSKNRREKGGLQYECKTCCRTGYRHYRLANLEKEAARKYRERLKHSYNITIEQYEEMVGKQRGVCAICSKPCKFKRRLSVDHDHKTGEIRGLLCCACNRSLGSFEDTKVNLMRAAAYLMLHE